MIVLRWLVYALGIRPSRSHPDLNYGVRARWWFRMEAVNCQELTPPLSVSPYRIVR